MNNNTHSLGVFSCLWSFWLSLPSGPSCLQLSQTMFIPIRTQRLYGKCWLTLFCEQPGLCGTSTQEGINSGMVANINKSERRSGVKERDWNNQSYFSETHARFLLFWIWIYMQATLGNCNSGIKYQWHLGLVCRAGRKRAKATWQWERMGVELIKACNWPALTY